LIDSRYNSLHNAQVLAMGASSFNNMNPLPSVKVELPTVVEMFGQKRFFINDAFTIENLLTQHQQHPTEIVHLATHATFNAGVPHDSYIQFWGEEKLRLDSLTQFNFRHPPLELLVLSACRTALGDQSIELGFTGLAVRAGVKSALGSLWSVSDEGTLALMREFYFQLRKVPTKAEAIRQAQIAMITGNFPSRQLENDASSNSQLKPENFSHPYFWADFILIGSPW
jgi:CHAT domain-containing protein